MAYRPPWLDERIKASTQITRSRTRDKSRQAARRRNRETSYVPPPPAKKAYVPKHLLAGGVPSSVLPTGTPSGIDIGAKDSFIAAINTQLGPTANRLSRIYGSYVNTLKETGTLPDGGTGLSSGMNEIIRQRIKRKSVAQRQQARQAARTANLATSADSAEGTIPSGWGGLSDLYRKKPYSDNESRLFDYSQQQSKFGSFEDYQKAVEARKHGYVPNRYDDIADYLDTDPEEGEGEGEGEGAGHGSGYGYPYYPGGPSYKTKEQYQPGHRPDWGLWSTFVQETTWNV